jgi:superfamily I DNA/RNA helicase
VILCRNNAPLFAMAIKLLKRGRYPELVGNDLGKTMLKILRGFGDVSQSQAVVLQKISEWKEEKLKKSRSQKRVMDQADCLTIFAQQGRNLGEAIAYCEHVLSVAGPVKLMTGHKSKGLEFDHVFILDQELIGDDQQDKNLRYVMQTRAKETLSYIRSSAFDDEENAQEN